MPEDPRSVQLTAYAEQLARTINAAHAKRLTELQAAVETGVLPPQSATFRAERLEQQRIEALTRIGIGSQVATQVISTPEPSTALSEATDILTGVGVSGALAGSILTGGQAALVLGPMVTRRLGRSAYESAVIDDPEPTKFLGGTISKTLDALFGSSPEARLERRIRESTDPAEVIARGAQLAERQVTQATRDPYARARDAAQSTLAGLVAILGPAHATAAGIRTAATRVAPAVAKAAPLPLRVGESAAGFAVAETVLGRPEAAPVGALLGAAFPFGGALAERVGGRFTKAAFAPGAIGALTYAETGDLPTAVGAMLGVAPFAVGGVFERKRGAPGERKTTPRESVRTDIPPIGAPGATRPPRATAPPGPLGVPIGEAVASPPPVEGAGFMMWPGARETGLVPRGRVVAHGDGWIEVDAGPARGLVRVGGDVGAALQRAAVYITDASRHIDPRRAITAPALPPERLTRALERVPGTSGLAGDALSRHVVAWARGRPGPSRGIRVAEDEAAVALRAVLALEVDGRAPALSKALAEAYFARNGARSASTRRALLAAAERVMEKPARVALPQELGVAAVEPRAPELVPSVSERPKRQPLDARVVADPIPIIRRAVTARAAALVDADVSPPTARREVGSLLKTGGGQGPDAGRFTRAGEKSLAVAAKDLLRAIARDVFDSLKATAGGLATIDVSKMMPAELEALTKTLPRTREEWGQFREAVKRVWGTKSNSGRSMAREIAWRLRAESGLPEERAREIMREATGKGSFAEMTAREVARAASAIREASQPKDPGRAEAMLRAIQHIPRAERAARKSVRDEDARVRKSVDTSFRTAFATARRGVATGEPPQEPRPVDGEVPPDPHGLFSFSDFDYVRTIHNVFRHVEEKLEIASRVILPAAHNSRSLRLEGAKLKREFRGELDRLYRQTRWGATSEERRVVSDILEANTGDMIEDTRGLTVDHPAIQLAGWLKSRLVSLRMRFGIEGLIRGYVPRFEDWAAWDRRLVRSVFSRRYGKTFLSEKDASFLHRRTIEIREDTIRDPLVWFDLYVDRGMRTLITPVLRSGLDHLNRVLKDSEGKFLSQRHADAYRAMTDWSERTIGIPSTGEVRMANGILKVWKLAQDLTDIFPGGNRLRSVQLDPVVVMRLLAGLQLGAYSGALGLRPAAIVRNFIGQLPSIFALLGSRHVLVGALEYVRGISRDSTSMRAWADALRQGAREERETGITSTDVTLEAWDPNTRALPETVRRIAHGVMAPFNASEVALRTIAFRGGESKFREAIARGRVDRVLPLAKEASQNRIRRILKGELDISRELERESEGAGILRSMTPEQQAAFEFGRSIAEDTQFLYSPETAPLISRSPLGRLAFQFLSFPVNYADFWLQVFRRGNLPATEKAAIAARMFGGTLALILAVDALGNAPSDRDRQRLVRRWTVGAEERGLGLGRMINDTFLGPLLGTVRGEGLPVGPVPQLGFDGLRLLWAGMQTVPLTALSLAVGEEPGFEPLGQAAKRVARDLPLFVPGGLTIEQLVESVR